MNLSDYVQTTILYNSSSADVGGTGPAATVTGTTAGSSGTGAFASGPGGWPWFSTAVNAGVSLANFEGCRFTAAYNVFSTGPGAGTSGIVTLQAYMMATSTSPASGWVAIKDAYALGYSTGSGSQGYGSTIQNFLTVDVYRPKLGTAFTAVTAVVQLPTSSGSVTIIADRYGPRNPKFTSSTGFNGLGGTFATTGAPVVSVNGTT